MPGALSLRDACPVLSRLSGLDVSDADPAGADRSADLLDRRRLDHGFACGMAGVPVEPAAVCVPESAGVSFGIYDSQCSDMDRVELDSAGVCATAGADAPAPASDCSAGLSDSHSQ
jgi:hypothetical protein